MQTDHLKCFVTLSEQKSIQKTSQVLHTTPQNVSRILKGLEAEMNTSLYERNGGGSELTANGLTFLEFAKHTMHALEGMQSEFQYQQTEADLLQEVTIYSSNAMAELFLNDILTDFCVKYPGIILNTKLVGWTEGFQKMCQDERALGCLFYSKEDLSTEMFDIYPVIRLHSAMIVSKNHPFVERKFISVHDTIGQKFVVATKDHTGNTEFFEKLKTLQNTDCQSVASVVGSREACYKMVAKGEYIFPSTIESFQLQDEALRKELVAIPVIDYPVTKYALIKSKALSPQDPACLLFHYMLKYLNSKPDFIKK